MASKKLLSRESLELLLQFPEDKLQKLCAIFMNDLLFLTTKELKQLLKVVDNKKEFYTLAKEIKKNFSNEGDFIYFKRNLLYSFSKYFGYLETTCQENSNKCIEAIKFMIEYLFIPSIQIFKQYESAVPYLNSLQSTLTDEESLIFEDDENAF